MLRPSIRGTARVHLAPVLALASLAACISGCAAPGVPSPSGGSAGPAAGIPDRTVSRTMQVAVSGALIHERPDARSVPVGRVAAGDAVTVVRESRFIAHGPIGDRREYPVDGAAPASPSWVEVRSNAVQGWMPARALGAPESLAVRSDTFGAVGESVADLAAADVILARLQVPLFLGADADPFVASPRCPDVPHAGMALEALDRSAAERAAAAAAAPGPLPAADSMDQAFATMAMLGVKQAQDPQVRVQIEVAKALERFTRPVRLAAAHDRLLARECLAHRLRGALVLPEGHPASCYVRWIGARIAAGCTLPYPAAGLGFLVLVDPEPDAAGLPGGPVLVTTGMLKSLRSEDELAVVLACALASIDARLGLAYAGEHRFFSAFSLDGALRASAEARAEQLKGFARSSGKALSDEDARRLSEDALREAMKPMEDVRSADRRKVIAVLAGTRPDAGWTQMLAGLPIEAAGLASASGHDPAALVRVRALFAGSETGRQERGWAGPEANRRMLERALRALPASPAQDPAASERWSRLSAALDP